MAAHRILVTRSSHQASPLADALRARGLDPVLIPTIELAPPTTFAPLDEAIAILDSYHWLLFTSANAVEAFAARAQFLMDIGSHPELSGEQVSDSLRAAIRIAAIGSATARALQVLGRAADLVPPKAVAESLAEALLPHALQPDGTPTRFLLVRAEAGRDHLPDTLRSAGGSVTIAPAYRTVIPEESIPAIQKLFSGPENYPQLITFTSSSTATNLLALLEASGLRPTLPPEVLLASIGPVTSQTLRDHNLPPHAEAKEPTVEALADTALQLLR